MKAIDFVKQTYPHAKVTTMIDNANRQTSYVILKGEFGLEIFPNQAATTPGKAWTNAKKYIINSFPITSDKK